MTPKRTIQAALLPYIFERVLDLVVIDSEHGAQHPESEQEREELTANLPALRAALSLVTEARRAIAADTDKIKDRLEREYLNEFQRPLLQRTTGYGFLVAVYLAHRYMHDGAILDDRIVEAVNSVSRIAESGGTADMIEGMKRSAWKMSGRLYERLHRLDYLPGRRVA